MNSKEYMEKLGHIQSEIMIKLEHVEELEALVNRVTTVISDMPRGSHDPYKREKKLAELIDLKQEVESDTIRLALAEWDIRKTISELADDTQRDVLERFYINRQEISEIAKDLRKTERQIYRIKRDALAEISRGFN